MFYFIKMASSDEDTYNSNSRKRGQRNADAYKQRVIKMAKVKGYDYTNYAGKPIPKRTTGDDCNCPLKCFSKYNDNEKSEIIENINKMKNKNEQDIYLQGLMDSYLVKRKRPRKDDPKRRDMSFTYFVKTANKREKVCKKAFVSLHGVSAGRVRRLGVLLSKSETPSDKRGRAPTSRRTLPSSIYNVVINHINTFEVKISHYSGKKFKYLNANLTVRVMHSLFVTKYPELNVKYNFYYKVFKEHFNLSFGRPQVDVCGKCEELSQKIKNLQLNDNAKRVAAAEKMIHIRKSKKFYAKIKEIEVKAKENDHILGISVDYMQNLPLPNIPVQEVFYYRQLWVNVFGIKNFKTGKSHFYVYHEGTAKKSPNEVCSLIHRYLSAEVPNSVKEVHIFSDGCPGQNRNNTVVRFLSNLTSAGKFDKICHYVPIRGHSFLACDRDFSVIKRKIKRCDRVYTPDEYARLIAESSQLGNFTVELLETNFSADFKSWWPKYYKKNVVSIETSARSVPRSQKVLFNVSTFFMFVYDSQNKGVVQAMPTIDSFLTHHFRLLTNATTIPELPAIEAHGKCPINDKKIKDIEKLMKYIPENYTLFYQEILNWPTNLSISEEESD